MMPKDFEKHERNMRFLQQRRNDIIFGRWLKMTAPDLIDEINGTGSKCVDGKT